MRASSDGDKWNVWSFDGRHGLWAIVAGDLTEKRAKSLADRYAQEAAAHSAVEAGYVALPDGQTPAGWGDEPSPE